uniref:Uncharacterized protein n=1 Tax=Alexandrium catenella TaxID=2925 RepID=A0A7S1W0I8_ALECA|mmetsp:Transcript_34455/g.93371  ORF Transcript_34455/g.93371 Transcript_34455/m.93371 type:complete len:312 (+) Transcript_34455:86-1021(+)
MAVQDGPKERLEKELEKFQGLGPNSQKERMPAFSFGTASRELSAKKVFISKKHERAKAPMNSPGPVYNPPSYIGAASKYSFGTDEQRSHRKAKYPDSSVDLTCATVDSQGVKFRSTKGVHFGTEGRLSHKNAEIIRVHPTSALGMESPGALEYSPDEKKVADKPPEYSFGPASPPQTTGKVVPRIPLPPTGTPRTLGPGSHALPSGMGAQLNSARSNAPSWGFGSARRTAPSPDGRQLLDTAPDLSSLGKQVVSSARSAPQHGFGSATREHVGRTTLVQTRADRGPRAQMPKPNFHLDLPPPARSVAKPGM